MKLLFLIWIWLTLTSKIKFNKAIFPGSFDPFHEGHYQILLKANKLFDEVIILVANNNEKNSSNILLRYNQTKSFLESKNLKNKVIYSDKEYTVDIAKLYQCDYIIRGIRNAKDISYESELYKQNKILKPEIETIYFFAEEEYINLCSSKFKK